MTEDRAGPSGPDLTQGIALAELADGGKLVGHVGDEPVLLVRRGAKVFAVGANCTHYNGPLGDGLVVDETVRCPWHHACFDLQTGEALRAPALSPIATWSVEQRDGKIFVGEKRASREAKPRGKTAGEAPDRIVIVGGGGADSPRRKCFGASNIEGEIVMLSARRSAAGRSAEPLQGLSRRQRAGGLGPASPGQLLF